jgi:hypothetical protein
MPSDSLSCRVEVRPIRASGRRRCYEDVSLQAREAGGRRCSRRRSTRLISVTVRDRVARRPHAYSPLWLVSAVGGLGEATERDGRDASVTGGAPVPGFPGSSPEVADFASLPDGILK